MAYRWPEDTDSSSWELDVLDRGCPVCGRRMYVCDHRYRRSHTPGGPVQLICKLNHCPDPAGPGHAKTKSPELELTLAPPPMAIGRDVFCWIGHRRSSRHMAVSLIQSELLDDYRIKPSEDAIEEYIRRYRAMLAARPRDAESLRRHYESATEIILCIDGLQPEEGHEALYVVRALTRKRVWFAEPLRSATRDEIRRLIQEAKEWARSLDVSVGSWMSDKQDAFVRGIAAEFPAVPHRYRDHHSLRDLAQPVPEADSPAKVQMRKEVRGLRTIEQAVLRRQEAQSHADLTPEAPGTTSTAATVVDRPPAVVDAAGSVVLAYCAAVRGILNDDHGGPPDPPGSRRAEAPPEVQESIDRDLEAKEGGSRRSHSAGSRGASRRAWTRSESSKR